MKIHRCLNFSGIVNCFFEWFFRFIYIMELHFHWLKYSQTTMAMASAYLFIMTQYE